MHTSRSILWPLLVGLLSATGAVLPAPAQVPRAVIALGEHGEDLYDAVSASRWSAAREIADSLVRSADAVPFTDARLEPQHAPLTAQIDTLHRALAAHARYAALEAANRVTYLAALMTKPYDPQPPADISMLDFYGRELEIWGAQNDLPRLHQTAADLRATWSAVRPQVEAHHGAAAAQAMERDIVRVEQAASPPEFRRAAAAVLDQVDVLERVFVR